MTTRTAALEVTVQTSPIAGIVPQTAIGLPPSDLDPAADQIRVAAGGAIFLRDYDPAMEQP